MTQSKMNINEMREWLRSVGANPSNLNDNGEYEGSLYLRSLTTLPENISLTCGGWLYLRSGDRYIGDDVSSLQVMRWQWRDRHYIKGDGIFQEVVSQRGKVYRVKSIGSDKVTYLVTDGEGRWAHGETLKAAKDDLIYKISDRDTTKYNSLTLDSVLTKAEAIQCYRAITGACVAGTKGFITSLPEVKEQYTIAEIIKLTKGYYGAETFANFFNK